ncbi:MAG: hypothetical protein ACQSGP_06005 [Frankia sp.]
MLTERAQLGLVGLMGALRCTIGAVGIARPALLGRFSGLDRVTAERTDWLTRMAAIRDLSLGAGQLVTAVRRPVGASKLADARLWVMVGALADAGDTAALGTATATGRVAPARGTLMSLAAAAAVLGALPILTARGEATDA